MLRGSPVATNQQFTRPASVDKRIFQWPMPQSLSDYINRPVDCKIPLWSLLKADTTFHIALWTPK